MSEEKKYVCKWADCGMSYSLKTNLRRHQRKESHITYDVGKLVCPVGQCGKRFPFMASLCQHVKDDHKIREAVIEVQSFTDIHEFTAWKNDMERRTHSSYVQHYGTATLGQGTVTYYFCHRSGQECKTATKVGKRMHALKSQGRCKMNATCTAHMSVKVELVSGKVVCKVCSFHIGHTNDLGHLRLSSEIRLEIASQLQQGVTVSAVMDTMRNRFDSSLQRDNLLCRRDIHNVKMQFNIGCIQKDVNDHTSVDIWVNELRDMNDACPVLLYKRQGEQPDDSMAGLSSDDFLLCLQTITQRQFLVKFGTNNVACLDSTHGTNQYGFNLITLMVVDDFGQGNPVAFMISTKEDVSALSAFFRAIKANLPADSTYFASHVMTDDASQYFNAWVTVFGPAEKRLCAWHVDRAWRRAIKENISDVETQVEIYHMLRCVMQELNEDAFNKCLSTLMVHMQQMVPRFASYFAAYCNRVTEWAYCHRKGTQANTNMYLESFHNILKTAYLERKANRRIDTLLNVLLKIARDKAFEHLIKVEKRTHSKKLCDIDKRHSIFVEQLPPVTDGGWVVPSEKMPGQQYFVIEASDTCSCSLHCSLCNCCPHMYQCTCVDFAVRATVCKHIHNIHELRRRSCIAELGQADIPSTTPPPVDGSNEDVMETQQLQGYPANPNDSKLILNSLVSNCRQVLAMAKSGTYSKELLSAANKHVSAAKATLQVAALDKPARLVVTKKVSSNKKLEKQIKFRSLRVKRRPLQKTVRKPSAAEVAGIRHVLMTRETNEDMNGFAVDTFDLPFADIPYCVDSEDVV